MEEVRYTHFPEEHQTADAEAVLHFLFRLFQPQSVLDLGCGSGTWLAAARLLGVKEIVGIDGLKVEDHLLKIRGEEFFLHNLREPLHLDRKFDLGICMEVAEHLPEDAAPVLVGNLCRHAEVILFSAAIPNQTGDHHFNEQWPAYWQKLFEEQGFYPFDILRANFWENEQVNWWYRQNMLIYATRKHETLFGPPHERVLPLVHPGLLALKDSDLLGYGQQLDRLTRNHITHPTLISSVKQVIKALLKGAR